MLATLDYLNNRLEQEHTQRSANIGDIALAGDCQRGVRVSQRRLWLLERANRA
ncbi:hypothetical protein KCP74_20815 [Salmonella enterica subsp. enterica]|nr:hypothetical protein KCP74_20815 [Salmonella enterica subsp. enterica]